MITRQLFGNTGHNSSKVIFGGYALSNAIQSDADKVLDLLLKYEINHIDTAPMYGNSEKCIGNWMKKNRENFFIATKTRSRSYDGAMKNLKESLATLQVDYIDLWQMHGLTNPQGWEKAMGPGGTLEAFIEAREKGLVKFLGVTGHGMKVPKVHLQSLERFNFDSVMLPYNYIQMQNSRYAKEFNELKDICDNRNVALQTIKSIACKPWGNKSKTYNTYFYEPLTDQDAITKSIHWALGLKNSFLITAGDIQLLPKILEAANKFEKEPDNSEMQAHVEKYNIQLILN